MIFSFDPPESGWTLNASATIIADPTAPTPPNVLNLAWGLGSDPSCRRTLTGLVVGQSYQVWARVNLDGISTPGLVSVRFMYRDGNAFDAYVNKLPGVSGWELRNLGLLNYDFADRQFQIVGTPRVGFLGTALIDTIYIGEVPPSDSEGPDMLSKWTAVDNAMGLIRGVNGSTDQFKTNLEGRVYSRLFLPAEQPTVKLPYACVPLDQESERIEYEGFAFESKWSLTGYAFFEDNPESDPLNSSGAQAAAKFRDDLIRAFMLDQHLDGQTQNCEIVSVETFAGSDGDPTVWVVFTLSFEQMGSAADLESA